LQPLQKQLSDDPNIPDVQFQIFKTKGNIKKEMDVSNYQKDIMRGRLNLFGEEDDFDYGDWNE
jgi:hypothetical protein